MRFWIEEDNWLCYTVKKKQRSYDAVAVDLTKEEFKIIKEADAKYKEGVKIIERALKRRKDNKFQFGRSREGNRRN
jgi:hypothetical protein